VRVSVGKITGISGEEWNTPTQGLMPPSSETCIKIAKVLKEFDGEE